MSGETLALYPSPDTGQRSRPTGKSIFVYYIIAYYYISIITSLLHIFTTFIITYYSMVITHYYIIIMSLLHHYYVLLQNHYYVLLHHYYIIITSLLHHYCVIIAGSENM